MDHQTMTEDTNDDTTDSEQDDAEGWREKPMREWTPEELNAAREARKEEKEQEWQEYRERRREEWGEDPYEDSDAEKADEVPPVNMKASTNWMAEARNEDDRDSGG